MEKERQRNYNHFLSSLLSRKEALTQQTGLAWKHIMVADLPTDIPSIVTQVSLAVCAIGPGQRSGGEGKDDGGFAFRVFRRALLSLLELHPKHLRLKEVLESLECFRVVARRISKDITTVLDLCCGHGILGIYVAYRYPSVQKVVCVDLKPSRAFADFKQMLETEAEKEMMDLEAMDATANMHTPQKNQDGAQVRTLPPCSNVEFVLADAKDVELNQSTLAIVVHGCNDITKTVLEKAREASSPFAVMPCCIKDKLYGIAVHRTGSDEKKYDITCGLIAGLFNAKAMCAIDSRITPRNLMIMS